MGRVDSWELAKSLGHQSPRRNLVRKIRKSLYLEEEKKEGREGVLASSDTLVTGFKEIKIQFGIRFNNFTIAAQLQWCYHAEGLRCRFKTPDKSVHLLVLGRLVGWLMGDVALHSCDLSFIRALMSAC